MNRLKEQWSCLQCFSDKQSPESIVDIFQFRPIDVDQMKVLSVIKRVINTWKTDMNFYTHNCQHFSNHVKKICDEEKICIIK
jgi:hypothetical protein